MGNQMRIMSNKTKNRNVTKLVVSALLLIAVIGATVSAVPSDTSVIGFRWNESSKSPILVQVDENGNPVTLTAGFFDNHVIWGNIRTCVVNVTNSSPIIYGNNNKGDGLDLTGTYGDVMVEIPRFFTRTEYNSPYFYYWISPITKDGYEVHPMFFQRGLGSEVGVAASHIYVARYEAYGKLDGGVFKLGSATGKQPVTGEVAYPDLPNAGRLRIGDARTYAEAKGSGWGLMNTWTLSGVKQLFYTEFLTLNSQAAFAGSRGVVDLPSGTGYAGLNTGANATDTNIQINGTGSGTGTDGKTPVCYRGMCDIWGGVYEFDDGYNGWKTPTEVRIVNSTGTDTSGGAVTFKDLLDVEDTILISDQPLVVDGFYTNILNTSHTTRSLFLPSNTVSGSQTTYFSDYYYERNSITAGAPNVLLSGGYWSSGGNAGVGYLVAGNAASYSSRDRGTRLEFRRNTENTATIAVLPSSKMMAINEISNFTISVVNVTPGSTTVSTSLTFNPALIQINNVYINPTQPAGSSIVALISNTAGTATINYICPTGGINGDIIDLELKTTNPVHSISTLQLIQPEYGNETLSYGFMDYGTEQRSTITNAPLNDNSTVLVYQSETVRGTVSNLYFWYKIPTTSYTSHAAQNLSVLIDSNTVVIIPVTANGTWNRAKINLEPFSKGNHTLTFKALSEADGSSLQNYTYSLFIDDVSYGINWNLEAKEGLIDMWDTGIASYVVIIVVIIFNIILGGVYYLNSSKRK